MKWTDVHTIAIELAERFPDTDPKTIRFTDLREKIMALPEFDDVPEYCGERILEAVQQAWIEEMV